MKNNMHTTDEQNAILITIGLPFYNAEKYIDYAIKSILNQSYKNWELLLTDDGSIDSSVDVTKKYLHDNRIKLMSDGENKGLAFRLNQQISLANGKYFARMDADDIMHPDRIRCQFEYLEVNLNIDVIGSAAYSIDTENNIYGLLVLPVSPNRLIDVFYSGCFLHPSVMARLDWYKKNQYDIRKKRTQDRDLWARTITYSRFANLNAPLMFYRDVGIHVLKKYLQSTKVDRNLINNAFPGFANLVKWKLFLRSYLKSGIYIMFSIIKKTDILIKWRSSYISKSEIQNASNILKKIIDRTTCHRI